MLQLLSLENADVFVCNSSSKFFVLLTYSNLAANTAVFKKQQHHITVGNNLTLFPNLLNDLGNIKALNW
jgi:hypothetical protein